MTKLGFNGETMFCMHAPLCKFFINQYIETHLPGIKKCRRGNGTMLTASFLRSAFS